MDVGFACLSNYSFKYDPKEVHWFMPKNDSFFFVPWEKPANFYFKVRLKGKTKLTMSYLNTDTMKTEEKALVFDPD